MSRSHGATTPFDAGLQPERTLLAWRRTALAVIVGSVAAVRLSMGTTWTLLAALGIVGAALASVGYLTATRRYRRTHTALHAGTYRHDALPIAFVAAGAVSLGLVAVGWVVVDGIQGIV